MIYFGVAPYFLQSKVAKWPTTEGRLTKCRVGQQTTTQNNIRRTSSWLELEYKYSVNGKEFTGDQLGVEGNATNPNGIWEQLGKKFESREPVSVHYNPEDPAEAYLVSETSQVSILMIVAGLFSAALGIAAVYSAVKPKQRLS